MKLTVKTLKNERFDVEVDVSKTVKEVKEIIATERSYQKEGMKLIYAGKILQDDSKLADHNVKETDFVIVMGKPAAKAKVETPASAAPAAAAPASTAAEASTAAPSSASPAVANDAPSAGTEAQVTQIMNMGFTREQATTALRAAFGNAPRAIEYLMNPESMPPQQSTAPEEGGAGESGAAQSQAMDTDESNPAPPSDSGAPGVLEASSPLYFLLDNPQFVQLRAFVQRQPQLLPTLLETLAREQPDLVRLLNENREDFYRLLNMPVGGGGGGGGGAPMAQPGVVRVTPEESAAIERLCQIVGPAVDRSVVIQAYFACDKNEEVAANYLFEHGFD